MDQRRLPIRLRSLHHLAGRESSYWSSWLRPSLGICVNRDGVLGAVCPDCPQQRHSDHGGVVSLFVTNFEKRRCFSGGWSSNYGNLLQWCCRHAAETLHWQDAPGAGIFCNITLFDSCSRIRWHKGPLATIWPCASEHLRAGVTQCAAVFIFVDALWHRSSLLSYLCHTRGYGPCCWSFGAWWSLGSFQSN